MRLKNGKENMGRTFLSKHREAFAVESTSNFEIYSIKLNLRNLGCVKASGLKNHLQDNIDLILRATGMSLN
jgi:hypothetical protein